MDYISRITAKYFHKGINNYIDFIVPDKELESATLKINIGRYTHFSIEGGKYKTNKATINKEFANLVFEKQDEIIKVVKNCYSDYVDCERNCHWRYNPYIFTEHPMYSIYYEGKLLNTFGVKNVDFNEKCEEFQSNIDDIVLGKVSLITWDLSALKRKIKLE